jgi:hypothetical protein
MAPTLERSFGELLGDTRVQFVVEQVIVEELEEEINESYSWAQAVVDSLVSRVETEQWRLGMKKKAQELPVAAKTLNALANMIKRNQWKPTPEDVPSILNFLATRIRADDDPSHFFSVLAAKGYKEFGDTLMEQFAETAPDLGPLSWENVVYRSVAVRKAVVASLTKRWMGNKYKKAELNGRKQILNVLRRTWKV